jgi:hypothetical protein
MIAPHTILDFYTTNNFRLVFWPHVGDRKGPREEGWTERIYTRDDYRDGYRVGIMCGHEISPGTVLLDVDIDWGPGSGIAQAMLPATGFMYGRLNKKLSHCWYTTPEALASFRYEDPVDKSTLIELRGTKQDGTLGNQSMAPPSIWSKDGQREPLEFVRMQTPAHVEGAVLKRRVSLAAVAMLLAKYFGKQGFGHEQRLAWAGFMLRLGLTIEECVNVGNAIMSYTGNSDKADIELAVESTHKRLEAKDKKVKGGPALAKMLGENGKAIVKRINEWLGRTEPTGIVMRGGELSEIVDRAEAALLADSRVSIFQRSGLLVRTVTIDHSDVDTCVRRSAGATLLTPVRPAWLLEQMGRAVEWYRDNAHYSRADPEAKYAQALLERGVWSFPTLRGVVSTPTLAADGRIIEQPGFDRASGLLLDIPAGTFAPILPSPTKDQAYRALCAFAAPLRGFPFRNDASKAVALAALLTALIRRSLRTAPLHGFDAPVAGTGKTMLAEASGILLLGVPPAAMSQGKSAEEDEKRLSTVLFAGDPIILIDNCERDISGDFLCSMLTQEMVQARILGLSERRILPSTALVLATGNNLTLAGDASRRAVVCGLDAKVERPDARVFDFDFHAELLARRAELVVAGLTVLRAYHVAGRPEKLTPMGSFSDWAWIRGALVWLGCADPADTRSTILDNDPRKDELITVMDLWAAAFGDTPTAVVEIRADGPTNNALYTKLIEVANCRGGKWSGKSVGWWLRRHKDRIVSGRSFRVDVRKTDRGQLWSLEGKVPDVERLQREPGEDDDVPF